MAHSLQRDLQHDGESYFIMQRQVLRQKEFLYRIYCDHHRLIRNRLPESFHRMIELRSGAGFIDEIIPQAVRTDVVFHPFVQLVFNGIHPPFGHGSLDGVVFLDVFHHIPDVRVFLENTERALKLGGHIVMIEPWISSWAKIIYKYLHREPLDWQTEKWNFESSGPISGANQALPWIVFQRDGQIFEREFPELKIMELQPMMPFRYLFGGSATSRLGFPGFFYQWVKKFETFFPNMDRWGMFALIVLEKVR